MGFEDEGKDYSGGFVGQAGERAFQSITERSESVSSVAGQASGGLHRAFEAKEYGGDVSHLKFKMHRL